MQEKYLTDDYMPGHTTDVLVEMFIKFPTQQKTESAVNSWYI